MSGIDEPISIGTEDPEYYAELLVKTSRPTNWRLPSDERSSPHVFRTQDVDDPHARRLQRFLDAVADISLCQQGNVSATMARLRDDGGTLDTRLYIVFNHENDEAAYRCPQHLMSIFDMLRQVPYTRPANIPTNIITRESEDDLIKICRVIHNYSFDIFAHRVNKHKDKLSDSSINPEMPDIRGYIEEDLAPFTNPQRSSLVAFLRHVDAIIRDVSNAQATKRLPTIVIKMLLGMYSYWTEHDLIPKDGVTNKVTLLDTVDGWLANSG